MSFNFLPYQRRYINDQSRFKIVEKSRRVGITYAQSYEDVEYSLTKGRRKVWFSSRDDSAAAEYIDYCRFFLEKLFGIAAAYIGTEIVDPAKDIQSRLIRMKNGSEIHAMTSAPGRFRSKGGKVILDEFAYHEHQEELYAAAQPAILRGDPIRIISTYNGMNNLYYRLVQKVKAGQLDWSLHRIPLVDAVGQGLLNNIMDRTTTEKEQAAWLAEVRKNCVSNDIWLQEYCCTPVDSATAFITYELLAQNAHEEKKIIRDITEIKAMKNIYIGIDIARVIDLTAVWINEKTDAGYITRRLITLKDMKFSDQKAVIWPLLALPNVQRACIDRTGVGMQMAEEAQETFGTCKIEGIYFSRELKEQLAYKVLTNLEDRRFLIPDTEQVRESFHNIKKLVTTAGNVRFDAERTEAGHSDEFWAAALSLYAADSTDNTPVIINSRLPRQTSKWLEKY